MDSKYKKSVLSMSSKQQTKSLADNWLILKNPNSITTVTFAKLSKSYIIGIITGVCFTQLFILSYPEIFSIYHYDGNSLKHIYNAENIDHGPKIDFATNFLEKEDKTIADQLFNEVRVLCWVMTCPETHETKAQHVKNTWGKRCNKLIFMSSTEDKHLGTVALPVSEGYEYLWAKTKEAFKYIYKHHLDEYDWFMKADDDTYVIVENLRKMLYAYSTEFPIFFGCKCKPEVRQGYMHGGPGYVLSKEALKRFVEKGLPNATKCREDAGGFEDLELSKCMENVEVLAGDSRDEYERGTMLPFLLWGHLTHNGLLDWMVEQLFYKTFEGFDCCSKYAISFHYVEPHKMYRFEYLIYNLRTFGIKYNKNILPLKKSLNEIISAVYVPINNNTT